MKHKISVEGFGYRLRPVKLSDAAFIIAVRLEDAERNKFIHAISPDVSAQEKWIENYFLREGDYYFVVENRVTGEGEGLIGVYDVKDGKAEWGRWVIKKDSLAAVESVDLAYRAAFERIGLNELYCRTVQDNTEVVSFHESIGEKTRRVIENAFEINGNAYNAVEQYADKEIFYGEIHPLLERKAAMIFKRNMKLAIGDFEFHHIGVASRDFEKDLAAFTFLGYARSSAVFEDEEQGIRGLFLEAKGQPRLELLSDLEGRATVSPILESGNKMYHFGYCVSDIEKALEVFIKGKAKLISPLKPSTYFGKRICFLLMPNLYMVELIEK